MKFIYSLFVLAALGLLMNDVSETRQSFFTLREMREVDRRLNSIATS